MVVVGLDRRLLDMLLLLGDLEGRVLDPLDSVASFLLVLVKRRGGRD